VLWNAEKKQITKKNKLRSQHNANGALVNRDPKQHETQPEDKNDWLLSGVKKKGQT